MTQILGAVQQGARGCAACVGPLLTAFGRNDPRSVLGAVDADVGLRAVQVAVDVGQSFIDTAEYYERAHEYGNKTNKQGGSETVIGRALTAAPSLKEQAFVTTKCTLQPYTEEKIRSACAYSMEKLQTDCIELYQLHGWDPATPVADQLGVLAALQEEGKIKYIGLNNAGVKQLDEAWDGAGSTCVDAPRSALRGAPAHRCRPRRPGRPLSPAASAARRS